MINYALLILALLVYASANATVSPASEKLERLRQQVEKSHDPVVEKQYLDLFPSSYTRFSQTFYGKDLKTLDELSDKTEEHLSLLNALSVKYPSKVLNIWMGVATNGHWEADAVGILQDQLVQYAVTHTQEFVSVLLAKPLKERLSIIRFLADVENHHSYPEYVSLMENLKRLGYEELYQQFAEAKQDRMKRHHHEIRQRQ